jgi:hypothetical protein
MIFLSSFCALAPWGREGTPFGKGKRQGRSSLIFPATDECELRPCSNHDKSVELYGIFICRDAVEMQLR